MKQTIVTISTFEGNTVIDLIINRLKDNRFEVLAGTVAFEDVNGTYDTAEDVEKVVLGVRSDEAQATIDLDDHCVVNSEENIKHQVKLI